MEPKEYKGYNGTVIVQENGIEIRRGMKGFLLGGGMLRGDKTIPYSSIVAVQFKKGGLTAGYIQFTLMGGSEAKSGLFQSTTDENSVNFQKPKNEQFEELKKFVEERIGHNGKAKSDSSIDDLEKLAELKKKGIITEEEFTAKKKKMLGI